MKAKLLIIIPILFTLQACAIIQPAQPTNIPINITVQTEHDENEITFESSKGSFGYVCLSFSPQYAGEVKARFSPKLYNPPIGYISIQEPSTELRQGIKLSQPESLESLASVNMFTAEINGIHGSNQTIYRYDNSIIKQFIEECRISTVNELKIEIEKVKKDKIQSELKAKQHQNKVATSINNALKKHNKKGVRNGGELAIQDVLLTNRYQDKAGYHHFLDTKNTAYLIDFSEYIVTQSLSNNKYVLRHIIEDYYAPAIVPPFQLILKTQKQLYEGETPKNSIVIYTGIELHQTISGVNKQFVSLTSLD